MEALLVSSRFPFFHLPKIKTTNNWISDENKKINLQLIYKKSLFTIQLRCCFFTRVQRIICFIHTAAFHKHLFAEENRCLWLFNHDLQAAVFPLSL